MTLKNKFYCILLISSVSLLQTSCESDTVINNPSGSIAIDNQSANIVINDTGVNRISFNTTGSWTIDIQKDSVNNWVSVSDQKGEKGNNEIEIIAQPNYDFNDRKAYITIKTSRSEVVFGVVQKALNGVKDIPIVNEDFKEYCLQMFDTNKDGLLSLEEADGIEYISIINNNINTLEGIEYFPYLKGLYCSGKSLTDLDLRRNTLLMDINISDNNISELDLSNNTLLDRLTIDNNQLTQLDLSNNTQLRTFSCENNQISSLDLSSNVNLGTLYIRNNKLTNLDLSNNINLLELKCSDNNLTNLNLSKNKYLYYLYVENNLLTTLDVSYSIKLQGLFCGGNPNLANVLINADTYPKIGKDDHTQVESITIIQD